MALDSWNEHTTDFDHDRVEAPDYEDGPDEPEYSEEPEEELEDEVA